VVEPFDEVQRPVLGVVQFSAKYLHSLLERHELIAPTAHTSVIYRNLKLGVCRQSLVGENMGKLQIYIKNPKRLH